MISIARPTLTTMAAESALPMPALQLPAPSAPPTYANPADQLAFEGGFSAGQTWASEASFAAIDRFQQRVRLLQRLATRPYQRGLIAGALAVVEAIDEPCCSLTPEQVEALEAAPVPWAGGRE